MSEDRDALTQLASRAALEAEMDRRVQASQPFVVALLDLDRFKDINVVHDFPTGDRVLAWVAGQLAAAAGPGELAARFDGQQLALILDASAAEARDRVQALRAAVLESRRPDYIPSTDFSAGVARYPEDGPDPCALVDAARRALWQAKSEGRGRVLFA